MVDVHGTNGTPIDADGRRSSQCCTGSSVSCREMRGRQRRKQDGRVMLAKWRKLWMGSVGGPDDRLSENESNQVSNGDNDAWES
eukprot:CCRYP_017517-RA/>CCRYP_017517-RA protein AED:0.39 eAED:0.58 QI:0/0/0/1/0/0/2/0/83